VLLAFLLASGTIYFFLPMLLAQLAFAITKDALDNGIALV
jgi:hypothetical protein